MAVGQPLPDKGTESGGAGGGGEEDDEGANWNTMIVILVSVIGGNMPTRLDKNS